MEHLGPVASGSDAVQEISWGSFGALCLVAACLLLTTVLRAASGASSPLNVRTFGARGDGRTDDTEALRRAVRAGSNRSLYFPAGTYKIRAPIDLPAGPIHLFGDGPKSLIQETTDNMGIFDIPAGSNGVEISSLQLVETGTVHGHQIGRGAIFINPGGGAAVSNVRIHDNIFHCASTSCIAANHLTNSHIRSNVFDNDGTGEHGVYLSSFRDGYSSNVTVESNTFHSSYRGKQGKDSIEIALQLRGVKHVIIARNRIDGWSDAILTVSEDARVAGPEPNVIGLIVDGNTIESPADDGFVAFAGSLSEALVVNNTITHCGRNGIRTNVTVDNSIFEHNKIYDSGEAGIRLDAVSHSVFSDNVVQNSGAHSARRDADTSSGIRLNERNTNNLFIHNVSNVTGNGEASQTVGLSIGGSLGHSSNTGNCFQPNNFSPNAKRDVDAALESDCSDMQEPLQAVPAKLIFPAIVGQRDASRELEITNPAQIPVRVLSIKSSAPLAVHNADCSQLRPSGSTCKLSIALAPAGARVPAGQLTIVYENGFGSHMLAIPLAIAGE